MGAIIRCLLGVLLVVAAAIALLDWETLLTLSDDKSTTSSSNQNTNALLEAARKANETIAQLRKQLQESQQNNAKLVQQVATIQEEEHQLEQAKDELEEKETELEQQLEEEEQELAQAKQKIQQEEKELAQAQEELEESQQELEQAKEEMEEAFLQEEMNIASSKFNENQQQEEQNNNNNVPQAEDTSPQINEIQQEEQILQETQQSSTEVKPQVKEFEKEGKELEWANQDNGAQSPATPTASTQRQAGQAAQPQPQQQQQLPSPQPRAIDPKLQEQARRLPEALGSSKARPRNKNLDLAYVAPNGEIAISFFTCAKCGSTSLFDALYKAIYGKGEWDLPGYPQKWTTYWPKLGLPPGSKLVYAGFLEDTDIPWHHYEVVRDPIDRYISAYHSKIRCCEPEMPGSIVSGLKRRPTCYRDGFKDALRITLNILENHGFRGLPGYGKQSPCFYFEEYAHLLKTAPNPPKLNGHVKPQKVQDSNRDRQVWTGTIAELEGAVENLIPYGFHKITIEKSHETNRGSWAGSSQGIKDLCEMALPEYERFHLPLNPLCEPQQQG